MRVYLLALVLAPALLAQDPLDPEVVAAAEAALVDPAPDAHALYDQAILAHGDHASLIAWLEERADDGSAPATRLAARIQWRAGDLPAARSALKPLLDTDPDL